MSQWSEITHRSHLYSLWNFLLIPHLPSSVLAIKKIILYLNPCLLQPNENKVLVHKLCNCKVMVSCFENSNKGIMLSMILVLKILPCKVPTHGMEKTHTHTHTHTHRATYYSIYLAFWSPSFLTVFLFTSPLAIPHSIFFPLLSSHSSFSPLIIFHTTCLSIMFIIPTFNTNVYSVLGQ